MDAVELSGWVVSSVLIITLLLWLVVLVSKYKRIAGDSQKQVLYGVSVLLGPVPLWGTAASIFALAKL